MSKMSREKGARGEREVVNVAKAAGVPALRTAQLQAGSGHEAADVLLVPFPELHLEVKRDERLSVDRMVAQADRDAPTGRTPVVVYRRNMEAWRAVVPFVFFLGLLQAVAECDDLRAQLAEVGA